MLSKVRLVLLIFYLFSGSAAHTQDESAIIAEYDKAFYSGKYEVGLPLINTLLALDPDNLAYLREKVKMLALLDQKKEFLLEFRRLRKEEFDNHFDQISEVIKFEKLPAAYRELIAEEAQKSNDQAVLKKFFPEKIPGGIFSIPALNEFSGIPTLFKTQTATPSSDLVSP